MRILEMFNIDSHNSEFYLSEIHNEYVHIFSFKTRNYNVSITSVIHCSNYTARVHEEGTKEAASFDDNNLDRLLEHIKYMIDNNTNKPPLRDLDYDNSGDSTTDNN